MKQARVPTEAELKRLRDPGDRRRPAVRRVRPSRSDGHGKLPDPEIHQPGVRGRIAAAGIT